MADPILELRGVSMDFPQPRGGTRRVLEGIDVAIYPEEVVALLGPSGSGKSTILRILAGLTKATRGEVRYRGTPTTGINPQIGFVFQSFALFPWMTVQGNIEAALVARGTSPDETKARAAGKTSAYGGATWYFCSDGCKKEFDKDPAKYAAKIHACGDSCKAPSTRSALRYRIPTISTCRTRKNTRHADDGNVVQRIECF